VLITRDLPVLVQIFMVAFVLVPLSVEAANVLGAQLTAQDVPMVVVTHDAEFARQAATQIVFMDTGRANETGPLAQAIDTPTTDRARRFFSLAAIPPVA
jgi:ABC-type polar amino acid transport system ATPase subunit